MLLSELLDRRRSTRFFDPSRRLEEALLGEILQHVPLAPSNFNLQPWRILSVRSSAGKKRLYACAHEQSKVLDAPVTLILFGDSLCWREAEAVSEDMTQKGYFPAEAGRGMVRLIHERYGNEESARQAVIKDVMLAAMTILLAATELGVDTAPMSYFDSQALIRSFKLPEGAVPVLLISLGYARKANPERSARKKVEDILRFESWE